MINLKKLQDMYVMDSDFENKDVEAFSNFVSRTLAERSVVSAFGSVPESDYVFDKKIDKKEGIATLSLSIGENSDLRGLPRHGLKPVLRSKGLKDEPNHLMEHEVYHSDSIPLSTYKKMSSDPILALGTLLMVGMSSSLKYSIKSLKGDKDKEKVIQYLYQRHHNTIIRNFVRVGMRNGWSFGEKIWQREDISLEEPTEKGTRKLFSGKATGLKMVKFLDPEGYFSYYKDINDNLTKVEQWQAKGKVSVKRNKLVWFALDREYSNIFGVSRFKKAYQSWFFEKINNQYMLLSLQKNGSPHVEVRYPLGHQLIDGKPVSNDIIAKEMAKAVVSGGGVIIPSTMNEKGNTFQWSVEYKEAKNNGVQHFLDALKQHDKKKAQALGIPDAVILSDNNFSETDAQADLLLVIAEDLLDQCQEVIQTDIIDYLVSYNYGPNEVHDTVFKIERAGLGRRKMLKEIIKDMLRQTSANGYKLNTLPDLKKALDEMGIPHTEFEEIYSVDENAKEKDLMKEKIRDEKSNSENRRSKDERDRGRPSSNKNATEGS